MQKKTNRQGAFTLVEIMIVVAIIGLLAAIAIPNFVKARTTSQMNACINNLRQLDAAKQEWALEHGQQTSATPQASDLQPYMGHGAAGELPWCPTDSSMSYTNSYDPGIGNIGARPACNIMPTGPYAHVLP